MGLLLEKRGKYWQSPHEAQKDESIMVCLVKDLLHPRFCISEEGAGI